jgi:hypothetical protein
VKRGAFGHADEAETRVAGDAYFILSDPETTVRAALRPVAEGAGSSAGRCRARAALCDLALDKIEINSKEPRPISRPGHKCQLAK